MKNHSLLTLDRLRLAVARNEIAKKRALTSEADTVAGAYNATVRRDICGLR